MLLARLEPMPWEVPTLSPIKSMHVCAHIYTQASPRYAFRWLQHFRNSIFFWNYSTISELWRNFLPTLNHFFIWLWERLPRKCLVRVEPTIWEFWHNLSRTFPASIESTLLLAFWHKLLKEFPVSIEPMNFSNSDRSFAGGCLSELNPYLLCEFWKKLPRKSPARIESILFFEFWQQLPRTFLSELSPYFFWILTETFQEISCQNWAQTFFEFWQKLSKKFPVRIACFGDHSDRKFPGKFLSELLKFVFYINFSVILVQQIRITRI